MFRYVVGVGVLIAAILIIMFIVPHGEENLRDFVAGIFFIESTSEAKLRGDYQRAKNGAGSIGALIVPGHDNEDAGAAFNGVKEADLTLALAEQLAAYLRREPTFAVRLSRTAEGYDPELAAYFVREKDAINIFRKTYHFVMEGALEDGLIRAVRNVSHGVAPERVALKLYGISRWANERGRESKIHLVMHLHVNDYPRRVTRAPGDYTGVAIYVPQRQYSNAKPSRAMAEAVFKELTRVMPASNHPQEQSGVIESQELIAVGAANTLDEAGFLIEAGYIYEPHFADPRLRPLVLKELAFRIYRGIVAFFDPARARTLPASSLLPHVWKRDLREGLRRDSDVLALQAALREEGLYPPRGETLRTCPLSGNFSSCTARAVRALRERYGVKPMTGTVDELLRTLLNVRYGQ